MSGAGSYEQSAIGRSEQYGVVNGHDTRCASRLGLGCDCRPDWTDWVVAIIQWIFVLFAPSALFFGMCLLANWAHR